MGIFLSRLGLVFTLLVLASCQPPGKTLQIYSYWREPGIQASLLSLAEAFQTQNPGLEIEIHTLDEGEFKLRVGQWLTSDRGPDLITWTAGDRLADLDQRMNLAELDHLFINRRPEEIFGRRFLDPSRVQGRLKLLPLSWYWWGIYYRPSVLRSLGISRVPESWAELEALAQTVKARNSIPFLLGIQGVPWPLGTWLDYLNIRLHGAAFHRRFLAGDISFDDPRLRQTLRKLKKMKDDLWFNLDYETTTFKEAQNRFLQGQGALMLQSQTILEAPGASQDLDFFPFPPTNWPLDPEAGTEAEVSPIDGLVKSPRAPQSALADQFLRFLLTRENLMKWTTSGRSSTSLDTEPQDLPARKGHRMIFSAPDLFQHFDRDTPMDFSFPLLEHLKDYLAGRKNETETLSALEALRRSVFRKL